MGPTRSPQGCVGPAGRGLCCPPTPSSRDTGTPPKLKFHRSPGAPSPVSAVQSPDPPIRRFDTATPRDPGFLSRPFLDTPCGLYGKMSLCRVRRYDMGGKKPHKITFKKKCVCVLESTEDMGHGTPRPSRPPFR